MALGIGSIQERADKAITAYAGNPQGLDAEINKAAKDPRIAPDIANLAAKSVMDKLLTSLENANLAASMPTPTPSISNQLDSSLRQRLENLINKNAPPTQNTMVGNAVATLNNRTRNNKGIMGNSPQQGMNVPQGKQTPVPTPPLSQQVIAQRPAQGIMSAPPQQGMPTRMPTGGGVMKYFDGDIVRKLLPNLSSNPAELINTLNGPDGERIISEALSSGINVQELKQAVQAQFGPEVTSALDTTISKITGPNNVEASAIDPSLLVSTNNVSPEGIETVSSRPMPRILREVTDSKATAPKDVKTAVTPEVKDKYGMTEEERRLSRAELVGAGKKRASPMQEYLDRFGDLDMQSPQRERQEFGETSVTPAVDQKIEDYSKNPLKAAGLDALTAASVFPAGLASTKIAQLVTNPAVRAAIKNIPRNTFTKPSTTTFNRGLNGIYKNPVGRELRDGVPAVTTGLVGLGALALGSETDENPVTSTGGSTTGGTPMSENKDTYTPEQLGMLRDALLQVEKRSEDKRDIPKGVLEEARERNSVATSGGEDKYALPTVEKAKIDSEAETAVREALDKDATRKADADFLGRDEKQKRADAIINARQRRLDNREYNSSDAFNAGLRAIAGGSPNSSSFAAGAGAMDSYTTRFNKDKQAEQNAIDALITSADAADTVLGNNVLTSAGKAFNDAITFFSKMQQVEQDRLIANAKITTDGILNRRSNDRADARSEADRILEKETDRLDKQMEREKDLQGKALAITKWVQTVKQQVMESELYTSLQRKLLNQDGGPGTGDYDEIKTSMQNILDESENNMYSIMYTNGYLQILENAMTSLPKVSSAVNQGLGLPTIEPNNSFLKNIQAQKKRIEEENRRKQAAALTQSE